MFNILFVVGLFLLTLSMGMYLERYLSRKRESQRILDLLEANNRYLQRARDGEELLRECKAQFRIYEHSHLAKKTPDANLKAKVNNDFFQKIKLHLLKQGVSA